ncbi:MAG: tRNA 2-thiouridine(34) synthase MnmA [Kiritimatiellia bacterium]|nr:tRNA 2-thiouridine(34) synthase MnmA [Kiritimatiellia bacterium]
MSAVPTAPLVAVGLSGGVDSSVAAALLLRQGFRVVGVTMCIWDGSLPMADEGRSGCFGPGEARDLESAEAVARRLGISHVRVSLAEEYRREVLEYFRTEYLTGRTPNPCVRCNRVMKFGLMMDGVRKQGIDYDFYATGHYARVDRDEQGRVRLRRAAYAAKDQTYFLSGLSREQLEVLKLPLGEMTKEQVREEARALGWADLADKEESQDFIESKDTGVLFSEGESRPGPIRTLDGQILGEHRGIIHYTIGQRKGLGIGGAGDPYYVIRIDACAHALIVGRHEDCFSSRLTVAAPNWQRPEGALSAPLRAEVKIRQQHRAAPALLTPREGGGIEVVFDEPQMSVAPGQIAVFYEGDDVLGGGAIA